ncbi:LOW QUALITY PROTEIN: olfactory receptor 2A2-like [Indicator indicator]|uniref:LOW QUALITY PROTEIN: olfactory receptor 2A2-like n=1 Tax=Indicator indicator TaxID=1002788 RepID=UPI0023DF933E|nr:LOW QUALITY PROTEIN: olfactory receptor 2A2-like [Indicator indicator]
MGYVLAFVLICLDYHFHSPTYYFLCHFSILDMYYASKNILYMLRNLVGQGRTISFAGCGTQIHLCLIFALTERVLLAMMPYDRCVAICHPLCYALIMCLTLAAFSCAFGFIFGTLKASLALHLLFCGPSEADHYFCEILVVLKLAYTDTSVCEVLIFAVCVCFLPFPLDLILISYLHIMATIPHICSGPGWHKTFSTCNCHLTVAGLFNGNAISVCMVHGAATPLRKCFPFSTVSSVPL